MRIGFVCLFALLGALAFPPIALSADPPAPPAASKTDAPAAAPVAPKCGDDIDPTAVENPKVSIVLDPKTSWQPRGGTIGFTVKTSAAELGELKLIVCFGWPSGPGQRAKFRYGGPVSLVKADVASASYEVAVPNLLASEMPVTDQSALRIIPLASMRVIAAGGVATPKVDVQFPIGITRPIWGFSLAAVAVGVAFGVFYMFARIRGVPGKGLFLWMISTSNGVASLSQAQIVLWTFLIGASAVYVMALTGVLIDISNGTLVLLGISGVAIAGSKLQNAKQDANTTAQPDSRTAVPGKVQNLLRDDAGVTDTEVRLAWTPPTTGGPVMAYSVEYQPTPTPAAGAGAAAWSAVGETIVLPHHTVLSLTPGTSYCFRVRAVNPGGLGDPSEPITVSTDLAIQVKPGAPDVTGGLHVAGSPTLTGMKLSWSAATGGPTGYRVQYRLHDKIGAWIDATGQRPTATNVDISSLASGVAYDFRVAATNVIGDGAWSSVVTGRTLRTPQWADLVVTGDGRGEIDVTRAQMLFFTLVAAVFVGLNVLTSYVIPDIPSNILLLMGISNGVYLTAKFIPD